MKIADGKQDIWDAYMEANSDSPYGMAVIRFAERWADAMERSIDDIGKLEHDADPNETVALCASCTSDEADDDGITGFQYGCAVDLLAKTWEYGDALARWHNKKFGYSGSGVANPALISIDYVD